MTFAAKHPPIADFEFHSPRVFIFVKALDGAELFVLAIGKSNNPDPWILQRRIPQLFPSVQTLKLK